MQVTDAIDQLERWCLDSSGAPIEIAPGRILAFASHAIFDDEAINLMERRLNFVLPASYRRFMSSVGQSIVFRDPRSGSGGMYFFSPEEAITASLGIWNEEEENGPDAFCLIGWHRSMGDYFGFVVNRTESRNFDVFCHEYPPSDYVKISTEIRSWRTFDEWIVRAVETYGEETL